MWERSPDNPIGIDIGDAAIKAVQLDRKGGVLASVVLPRLERGPETRVQELSRLVSMLHRQGFDGSRVVSACPWQQVMTEPLHLPPVESESQRLAIAAGEFAQARQLQPGTFELGIWPIPKPARGGDGAFVMASAAMHEDAEALFDQFTEAGLELAALDTPAAAMMRGALPLMQDRKGLTLLVDLGWTQARVAAVLGDAIVFERGNNEAGMSRLYEQIASLLEVDDAAIALMIRRSGISPDAPQHPDADPSWASALAAVSTVLVGHFEAAAHELTMAVNYVGHRYPDAVVERVVLLGGGACVSGIDAFFTKALAADTVVVTPGELGLGAGHVGDASGLVAAMGLARYGDTTRREAA